MDHVEEYNKDPNPYNAVTMFCKGDLCQRVKLFCSFVVVTLLILVVFTGISLGYCVLKVHPALGFLIMFFCLTLLAYVEALHYACVACEKWDMKVIGKNFPRALRCHALVDDPVKLKKFLVGRQFFVIFVVFLLAQLTAFPDMPSDFAGMPAAMTLVLLQTGLPGVALTLTYGQLISQIFVEQYPVQFLNLPGTEFVIRLSLFTENIGTCHWAWLLFHLNSWIWCRNVNAARQTMSTTENDGAALHDADGEASPTVKARGHDFDDGIQKAYSPKEVILEAIKYCWSAFITIGSIVLVFYGISKQAYVLNVNSGAAFCIVFVDLAVLFYLEGLMICIVETQYWDPESWRDVYPRAYKLHKLLNKPDNIKRFIIGRQFCTVLTGFLLAQVFTLNKMENEWGWDPVLYFIVVKSGLIGVMIVLAHGQLMPELLAAEYPLRFMDMYGSYTISYISLFFDAIGVGHHAWAVFYATRPFCCKAVMTGAEAEAKPAILRVASAELLAATGSPLGRGAPSTQSSLPVPILGAPKSAAPGSKAQAAGANKV